MKKFSFYIVLIALIGMAHGQSKSVLDLLRGDRQVANEFYDEMDYRSAIHFYEKTLEKNPDDLESKFKIAKSYLSLNQTEESEIWLRSLVSHSDATLEMRMLYTEVLRRNGKMDQVKEWYGIILSEVHNEEIASKLHFINNIESYQRDAAYEVNHLAINSELSDFSLQPYHDNMIFLSARQTERYIQHQPSSASSEDEGMLRYFTLNGDMVDLLIYNEELKPYYHDGPLGVYNQNHNVAFTRNDLRKAEKTKGESRLNLKIYFADCSDPNNWYNIQPFEHNSNSYSNGHPALNSNGTVMFFSSDMPGGYGGADLYITYNYDGTWSTPENLGPTINTSANELFPTVFNDTTLYFSSDGLGGFGGLDLFVSSFKNNKLSRPSNMGSPINSPADDFSLTMSENGRSGHFSSNREGGMGMDDIYAFKTTTYAGVAKVLRHQDNAPIADAEVRIEAVGRDEQWTATTDTAGVFQINVPYDADYRISVSKEGHSTLYKEPFSTQKSRIDYDTLALKLWEHDLFAKGLLYSNETQERISEVVVVLENLDNGVKDSITTREDGAYSFALVPDTRYKVTASHEGFIPEGYNLNTTGIYAGDLLNDILLEEVFVDKVVTYFGFNETQLSPSDYENFDELVRTLKRFPKSILNIATHADARGTNEYNKRLSEGRLNELIKYFGRKGIPKRRIRGIAFGEALLLNQCSSGVECGEEDHSKNRRGELKVQMEAIH